jgi:hypothetical protein
VVLPWRGPSRDDLILAVDPTQKGIFVMRRLSVILLVALGFLAGSLSLTSASAHDDRDRDRDRHRGHYSLTLTAKTVQAQEVDSAPAGPSVGDYYAFHDDVYQGRKAYKGKKRVGTLDGVCHVTYLVDEETGTSQCAVTLSLHRGSLTAQGIVEFDEDSAKVAITGGTGRYVGAGGEAHVRFLDDDTSRIYVSLR